MNSLREREWKSEGAKKEQQEEREEEWSVGAT